MILISFLVRDYCRRITSRFFVGTYFINLYKILIVLIDSLLVFPSVTRLIHIECFPSDASWPYQPSYFYCMSSVPSGCFYSSQRTIIISFYFLYLPFILLSFLEFLYDNIISLIFIILSLSWLEKAQKNSPLLHLESLFSSPPYQALDIIEWLAIVSLYT